MKKIIQLTSGIVGFVATPMMAFAQGGQFGGSNIAQGQNAFGILGVVNDILGYVIPILITLGVVYLIWGVIKYITADDADEQTKARSMMINAAIGLFFILAIWGIIGLISNTFGIGVGGTLQGNQIPGICDPYDPNC